MRKAQERALREAERARLRADRALAKKYLESRSAEALGLTRDVEERANALSSLLRSGLGKSMAIRFDELKELGRDPEFTPGSLAMPLPPPRSANFEPPKPHGFRRLLPGASKKHQQAVVVGQAAFQVAHKAWESAEADRVRELALARGAHEKDVARFREKVAAHHADVDKFEAAFTGGDPQAVAQYFSLVLDKSQYPQGFPTSRRVAFVPASRQLVVEIELPTLASAVPAERAFRHVRARDEIEAAARPARERRDLYEQTVAQMALRTLHELVHADTTGRCETIVLNCVVRTVDPATGRPVMPCLVSLRVSRDQFLGLDLSHIEATACLKGLSAGLSRSPADLSPVRPVLDFDMVDPRFVEEADVLAHLDSRPNLMELTPQEFESLITNLFTKMGLDTALTRPSRDGGVDCVAWDSRPVLGGKVVIQAKRYKNTVGVSAVRDLFGTVQNEGASKGILVTTSGYGKASFDFANGKPLELLDGSNLLFLLKQHAETEARIVVPETWVDVIGDLPGAD